MRINKREILCRLVRKDLWESLSPQEIRLYLLLIITSDGEKGKGKLTWKEIRYYLGPEFTREKLKRAADNLQKFGLVEISSYRERDIQFKL
jgi:hypothetical protein